VHAAMGMGAGAGAGAIADASASECRGAAQTSCVGARNPNYGCVLLRVLERSRVG
jgi:hypothetical protein